MKILGIGNAIVDVICKVNDNFIEQNNLTKSTMKLFFDENDIDSNAIKKSEIILLEGYLWDEGEPKKAFI